MWKKYLANYFFINIIQKDKLYVYIYIGFERNGIEQNVQIFYISTICFKLNF